MILRRVRAELARSPEFPEGSVHHGYELILPLDKDGKIDVEAWRKHRALCSVRRFWNGDDDEKGEELTHTSHGHWSFSYPSGEVHREPIHRFEDHAFREGEYVSVRERDGRTYTFRIVAVKAASLQPKAG